MFCPECGHKLQVGNVFCTNCGVRLPEGKPPRCPICDVVIPAGAAVCTNCGTAVNGDGEGREGTAQYGKSPTDGPQTVGPVDGSAQSHPTSLQGFSERYRHPEVLEALRKRRKSSRITWAVLVALPLLGFPLAGLLIKDYPLDEGIVIGVAIAAVLLLLHLFARWQSRRPIWEGVVVRQFTRKRRERRGGRDDPTYVTYTEYTTEMRTERGKKKRIVERRSGRNMYDYLTIGDRVRYYPQLGTYEKYDKSQDRIIYCNICRMMNPIHNDRCKRCGNLLFK